MEGKIAINVIALPLFTEVSMGPTKDQREILSRFSGVVTDEEFAAASSGVTVSHSSSDPDPFARTYSPPSEQGADAGRRGDSDDGHPKQDRWVPRKLMPDHPRAIASELERACHKYATAKDEEADAAFYELTDVADRLGDAHATLRANAKAQSGHLAVNSSGHVDSEIKG